MVADIDFDELDRAVTSHLKKGTKKTVRRKPTEAAPAAAPSVRELPQPATVKPVVQVAPIPPPPISSPVEASRTPQAQVVTPQHQPAVKPHRGRFMDMVGNSSNKPTSASQTPGATLAPATQTHHPIVLDMVKPVVQPPRPTRASTQIPVTPHQPLLPAPSVVPPDHRLAADDEGFTKPATDHPPKAASLTALWAKKAPELKPEPRPDTVVGETPPVLPAASLLDLTPQATPFLEGTKVSKRPLNQLGEDAEAYDDLPMNDQPATSGAMNERTRPNAAVPRELQADVVRAEQTEVASERSPARPPFATKVNPADDDDDHPLFDETTYHEPIIAVEGRRVPTWLKWLTGVVLCLVAGAGAGYALFTFGL